MNKSGFVQKLSVDAKITEDDALKVNNILEENFFFSKKNKDKIVSLISDSLAISSEKAEDIYNKSMNIINTNIKNKIKHPFR